MIRITSIHRKVDVDGGGIASDEACNVVLLIGTGSDVPVNKARFLLTDVEALALEEFTKTVERRIGTLLVSDYIPAVAPED